MKKILLFFVLLQILFCTTFAQAMRELGDQNKSVSFSYDVPLTILKDPHLEVLIKEFPSATNSKLYKFQLIDKSYSYTFWEELKNIFTQNDENVLYTKEINIDSEELPYTLQIPFFATDNDGVSIIAHYYSTYEQKWKYLDGQSLEYSTKNYDYIKPWIVSLLESHDVKTASGTPVGSYLTALAFIKERYEAGKKTLYHLETGVSAGVAGYGHYFSIDLTDYFDVTVEGRNDWVTVWLGHKFFVGFTPLPYSYSFGIKEVDFIASSPDQRENYSENTSVIDYAKYFVIETGKSALGMETTEYPTELMNNIQADYSFGPSHDTVNAIEMRRSSLNRLLADVLFSNADPETLDWKDLMKLSFGGSPIGIMGKIEAGDYLEYGKSRPVTYNDDGTGGVGPLFLPTSFSSKMSSCFIPAEEKSLSSKSSTPGKQIFEKQIESVRPELTLLAKAFDGTTVEIKNIDEGRLLTKSDPEESLIFSNGELKRNPDYGSIPVKATMYFQYAGVTGSIDVHGSELTLSSLVDVSFAQEPTNLQERANDTFSVVVTDAADAALYDYASVEYEIRSSKYGDQIITYHKGTMVAEGNGRYSANITWPGVNDYVYLSVAARGEGTHTDYVGKQYFLDAAPSDLGARILDYSPKKNYEIQNNATKAFRVKCSNGYGNSSLDRVEWYKNAQLIDTYQFPAGSTHEIVKKEILFSTASLGEGKQSVQAKLYREDGVMDSVIWRPEIYNNESPMITPLSPANDETLVLPLGDAGKTEFVVTVVDKDDNAEFVSWYLDGELFNVDTIGGSADASTGKSDDLVFIDNGDHIVEAVVTDSRNNTASTVWHIHAGVQIPGNSPPSGKIINPDGIGEVAVFRSNTLYDFDFEAYDVDGNLAYGRVWVNDEDPLRYHNNDYQSGEESSETLSGFVESISCWDFYFDSAGEHEIKLLVRDGMGEETIITKTVNVIEAESYESNTAPIFASITPAAGSYYIYENDSERIEFEIFGVAKDLQGNLKAAELYVNGVFVDKESLSDSSDSFSFRHTFEETGVYNLQVVLYDELGLKSTYNDSYRTYRITTNQSAGRNQPEIISLTPAANSTLKLVPGFYELSMTALDIDGDFNCLYLFNSAGPLSNVDGNYAGKDYELISLSSDGIVAEHQVNFQVTQSGQIGIQVLDEAGYKSIHKVINIEVVNTPLNNAPSIEFATFNAGDVFYVQDTWSSLEMLFKVYDQDGDLSHAQIYVDGVAAENDPNSFLDFTTNETNLSDDFSEYNDGKLLSIGIKSVRSTFSNFAPLDSVSISPDYSLAKKTAPVNIELRVYDKKGNFASRNATVSFGPYNHSPIYPENIVHYYTYEEEPINILPKLFDEDGDSTYAYVKIAPVNGTISVDDQQLIYSPKQDFNGEDSLTIACSDGVSETQDVEVQINVAPVNDPPIIVDNAGAPVTTLEVVIDPGQSQNITNLIQNFFLFDIDGNLTLDTADLKIITTLSTSEENINEKQVLSMASFAKTPSNIISLENAKTTIAFLDEENCVSNTLQVLALSTDFDEDGMKDDWEIEKFGDITTSDRFSDQDNDGLLDYLEYIHSTSPLDTDTDNDLISDFWEVNNGLNPLVDDSGLDPDKDGLSNYQEYINGTNPLAPDVLPKETPWTLFMPAILSTTQVNK